MADETKRRVTRDVDPSHVRDLLERPPRAALAFAAHGTVELTPVLARCVDGRHLVGVPAAATRAVAEGMEGVLLIDDGFYWFELRGISVRGRLVRVQPPAGSNALATTWYEVVPGRTLAWDYAALREE